MHGCSSGSAFLVNAEVDSMGGVLDGGVGIGTKASPRRAAIEKAQSDLRQEFDVRDDRRRELEFLEKGGNPLDFKLGQAASVSVQSTSHTDQHPEQIVTSAAKGSFPSTASPPGDSIESSGRPRGPTVFEPNSADNLLLFDGDNELLEGKRNSTRPSRRSSIAPPEQSSQIDGSQNAKESEDSAIFRPYARRNRSRSIRDGARSNSTDIVPSRGGLGSSLPARQGSRDTRGSISETNNQKDQDKSSNSNLKSANQNGETVLKGVDSDNRLDMELNGVQETSAGFVKDDPRESDVDVTAPKDRQENEQNGLSKVDAQQTLVDLASVGPDVVQGKEEVVSAGFESKPCGATEKIENETSSGQLNGFSSLKRDRDSTQNDVQIGCAALSTKNLDSESSCTQTSFSLDGNNESDMCNNTGNIDNVIPKDQSLASEGAVDLAGEILVQRNNETMPVNSGVIANEDNESVRQNHRGSGSIVKVEEEIHIIGSDLQNEVNYSSKIEGMELNDHTVSKIDGKSGSTLGDNSNPDGENSSTGRPQGTVESSIHELPDATLSGTDPAEATGLQTCDDHLIVADKAHEDSILEEARIIEAKRKRISELSVGTLPMENRRKSRWDFVLEEMAWLANDFAQERLWKITAASLISRQVALASQLRFEEQDLSRKQRKVAYTVAKAVMQFWHSVEVLVNSDNLNIGVKNCKFDLAESASDNLNKAAEAAKIEEPNLEASKNLEVNPGENLALAVKGYAVRFLKYNRTIVPCVQAEAPLTPDRMCDLGIQELSSEDQFTKESLFYTAPPGAMETYRKSIESYLIQYETTGSSMMQEDVDTSLYDVEELSQENVYDEDEGETSTYYLPGTFERSKSSNFTQKNRKHFIRTYTGRSYELGADLPYGHCTAGPQQSILIGKRPANNLNVGSIPTKRVRTASRPRVPSPFGAGATGNVQALNKTDASSGDTNSFQDDQSTLHGGSQIQKSLEGESVADFEKSLPFDSGEITKKPKKKKKAKHLNSTYEQRWQIDSSIQNEQRDNTKKRLESHHLESNGSSGLFAQHIAKKPKMMKQSLDNNFDNIIPMPGSIPSPVASQMSNMSNTNKFMKLIGGRDRGRKSKSLKMPAGQPGSGSPWSLFEDQALVVLVHDMGPNWELVSDAINSTLQFKCIFRKPKECKERHKILMDRTAGDGADSAEDSGSSQPYPSTLPGIPKGSARQLFQRLQGPMEEDTLKSHFEKIISIGHRQHYRKSQTDNQDLKQIAPVHNSHVAALSQVCPNSLNGGFLTPLDLCDTTASSPDVLSSGYPSPHSSSLSITNQGSVVLPATVANSSLQGSSSSMVLGSNMSSPSGPINASTRDGRYGVSRASLPVDEQQRPQQYNPMLAARNVQQSSLPVSGALQGTDRGVRMLPGVNGMGVMSAMNRGMPMSRPGFQGMASSSMLNPGSMLSSSMVGMPSPVTGHTGANSGQGNSMLRPREALHMMRPGQSPEHQRQMMVPELQMQGQGNSQSVPSFNGLSSNFSNQTAPPVPTYPVHAPQQHQMSTQQSHALHNSHHPHLQGPSHTTGPQHPAYARQRQQRMMQQQQQQQQQHHQFSASNALMQHVQPQPQLPLSSSLQNNSQIQQTSQPVSLPSLTPSSPMPPMSSQLQQKHNMPPHGISRGPQTGVGGLNNQMGKQRQRQALQQQQQFQQSGRHHPQQRQQSQSQPQAKVLKGMGRGNMLMHPNFSVDPSHLNGISMTPGSQAAEKGEPVMHMMQGQGLYPGSGLNSVQPSRSVVPPPSSNQSQLQQKLMSGPSPSLKQLQKMASHSDSGNQGQVPSSPSGHALSASQQAVLPSAVMAANHHQQQQLHLQPHQKQVTQSQPSVQRVLQQNHRMNSDLPNNSQAEQPHADQRAMNNSSHTGTTTSMSQVCMESTNATPAVSSSSAPQWKAPEPLYDSGMQNPSTLLGSAEGSALEKSSRSNPIPPINQGLVQRQFSGGLPPHGHTVEEQWQQQQQPQLKQPLGVPPPSLQHQQEQQDESSQQQVQPNQQSPQQMQHLQSGQSSLYIRPTNS